MRSTPLPDSWEGLSHIIGPVGAEGVRVARYAIRPSRASKHRATYTVRIALDDEDRRTLADGGVLWLTLDGGKPPWSIEATREDAEVPA